MEHGVVIIGGSIAGYNVAKTLRKDGYEGKITIVNQQDQLPYDVSTLSKDWMLDKTDKNPPLFKDETFYSDAAITLTLHTTITQFNPKEKTILTEKNEKTPYDTLVLATGSVLRTLDAPGVDAAGVFYLRDFSNALKMKEWAETAKEIVVVGAGFIGLEVASTFSQWGRNVTVVEFSDHPLGRILGEDVSHYFVDMHQSQGVRILTGEGVQAFEKDNEGNVTAAITTSGKVIPCQMAVIGIGVTPNISINHPDLKVERGFVVNEYGETSLPDVYAAGDCTVWPYQGQHIHVEHWEHANAHGKAIAKNILKPRSKAYRVRPYFWTDQYDQNFEYLGHALKWAKTITRGSLANRQFTVAYVDENNVPLAVFFANKGDDRKAVAAFMDRNQPIMDEAAFADLEKPL